jgi:hypothetical protein
MKFQLAQKRASLGSDTTADQSVCQADFHRRDAEYAEKFSGLWLPHAEVLNSWQAAEGGFNSHIFPMFYCPLVYS